MLLLARSAATSRVYYTSILGAECTALLCSVSHMASSSFQLLKFNNTLMSNARTLPVNIFTWKKEKPYARGMKIFVPRAYGFSFFQVKMVTGSVHVLLTSVSFKLKLKIFRALGVRFLLLECSK